MWSKIGLRIGFLKKKKYNMETIKTSHIKYGWKFSIVGKKYSNLSNNLMLESH